MRSILILSLLMAGCNPDPLASGDGGGADAGSEAGPDAGAGDAGVPDSGPWGGRRIDDPYSTDRIALLQTVSQQGYTGEYYVNRAYTCGKQGYQTFLLVYADALPLSTVRPLWVRMHGGGVGAYDATGTYVPVEMASANQSGIVSDSHVFGAGISDNAALRCMPFPYDPDLLLAKIGPLSSPAYYPEAIVAAGDITVPIYHLWNRNDRACCGSDLYTYTDPQGGAVTESGCFHEHDPYARAIAARPPGGVSLSVEVCVNDPQRPQQPCRMHSPSKMAFDATSPVGDQLHGNRDFNQHILDWVSARLLEPPP